ncbi:ABC-type dipeptide/oligopeptide/nickel transport system permease component [Spelaeicoccus albus]|uniref:ABC-type dipeptide/oligopeptide/nickel transport system permease component n=1 Tax=Spelaeicoccus albus TaxID=1280376 RepID=A0A7Z0D4R4_9MICO|nr:ABC-type dipeptide/oligopeptide/nickel transport system permease component [Spelaeicoccus albus]
MPVVIGATFIIYALTFAMPGDPVAALTGSRPLPASTVTQIREAYHLNDPFLAQYGHYMWNLVHGNLGIDFFGRPVSGLIAERWPNTFKLALTAWVLKLIIGLAIGVYGGLKHNRAGDHFALIFTVVFLGVPGFVIALGAQTLFGVQLNWVDPAGIGAGWPMAYILPALVMAFEASASLARLTRTSLVDVLRTDYMRTARAKGLSPSRSIWKHALRNAMIPVVTYLGLSLAGMLGGAVIIEAIFNIPGIGQLMVQAIHNKEGTVVVGIATLLVIVYLVFNLLVDLTYGLIDPRVRV